MKKIVQIVLLAAPLIISVAGSATANHENTKAAAHAADAATVHAASVSAVNVNATAIPAAVPEPSTFILFGAGAAGFILYKKFQK